MCSPSENLGPDGKVFALRTRRSVRKNGQAQNNSGLNEIGDGNASVPPANRVSNAIVTRSTRNPQSNYYRAASNMAQLILPPVATVAAAIPLVGPPMQTAINGLLAVLQIIDRNQQNKKDLAKLESRLCRLSHHLCNAPTARHPSEQLLRDSLISMLQETSSELNDLHKQGIGSTSAVAQAIVGCSNEINEYLLEYSAFAQMQIGHAFAAMQSPQLGRTSTLGIVTLVDATGYEHALLVEYCTSFEQFTMMLGVVFQSNSIQGRVQRHYLQAGQYNLSIDHNTEVTQLTSNYWPSIEAGTTVVMSVVVKQRRERTERYQCYLCKTWNDAPSSNKGATYVIDCGGCGKRFQVSDTDGHDEERQDGEVKENSETTAEDTKLIQNWHLQNEELEPDEEPEEEPEPERREREFEGEFFFRFDDDDRKREGLLEFARPQQPHSHNNDTFEHEESRFSFFEGERGPSRMKRMKRNSNMESIRKIIKKLHF